MKKNKVNIVNLGCRLNIYEGEVIRSITKNNINYDCTIINSCSVTQEAEKKIQYEIRHLLRFYFYHHHHYQTCRLT